MRAAMMSYRSSPSCLSSKTSQGRSVRLTLDSPSNILLKLPTPRPTVSVREAITPAVTDEIARGSIRFAILASTVGESR